MERVETWTESVANTLYDFSDKLRRRDFLAAEEWLTPGFAGQSWSELALASVKDLSLSAQRTTFEVKSRRIVGRTEFLSSIASHVAPWRCVDFVLWKVKGAEFESKAPLAGKIRFKITMLGLGIDGGPRSLVAWANARVELTGNQWQLALFELTSLDLSERSTALFSDVSASAGVVHTSVRFADVTENGFAWNGAASADVDGDGGYDIFLPSRPQNFLYMSRPEGGFFERAAQSGVAEPAGGTGPVFFDFDNDGDQDLAVADVGWKTDSKVPGGNRLRLYVNDGKGKFTESGAQLGFDALCHGFSLSVFDFDGDSWLDVFVANYGRTDVAPNDSWTDANNGTPNLLLRNLGGKGFENVASSVGLADTRWSYAAAAADFDGDGDQDLYVANDYGVNSLWRNDAGRFTDVAETLGVSDLGNGMGATWGDLDNDGKLDLYVANMSSTAGNRILGRIAGDEQHRSQLLKMAAGNSIFLGRTSDAGPSFERLAPAKGGVDANWAWSAVLADFDLDGRLDIFCANGFITGETAADT